MRKSRRYSIIVCIFILQVFLFIGCAALIKGTHEEVAFSSDPSGAEVYVNGRMMGTTPFALKLESKETYVIEFKKEGYGTKTYTITNHLGTGWVILDVIFGLVPVIVDAATGAWYELDQENINAILAKQQ